MTRLHRIGPLFVVAVLLASACGGWIPGRGDGGKVIRTSAGEFRIVAVESGEQGPPGCGSSRISLPWPMSSSNCVTAPSGTDVLTVTLESVGRVKDAETDWLAEGYGLSRGGAPVPPEKKVHIQYADQRVNLAEARSIQEGSGPVRAQLSFIVPAGAKNLQLVWPDNPPVSLGR